ncbi:uncharacterized protein N7515_004254 [Penicillium bovifimosum]|uniref:Uncharacterized protein n=1 Tax=Penicillium bovifimosum TaxID=126998 RepID=A0A9W9H6N1_9EURO|nr:uncharacterized protein N7515_004254 [Penicillium bovifimosum]KAJ5139406.1 hypothetical protein N7515_004254 [Penicillium bovifimosum]
MSESAPPSPRCLLVSQDNHGFLLVVTGYPCPALPFLKMKQYSPWNINEKDHTEDLAKIINGVARA